MGKLWGIAALAVLSILSSACTAHSEASAGVLTGNARACGALAYVPTAHLQVYKGDVLIASKGVPDNSTYRFVLAPGHYYITNTGNAGFVQGLGRYSFTKSGNLSRPLAQSVSVTAGGTTHLNVPNDCY
jgi:hypothetical protein